MVCYIFKQYPDEAKKTKLAKSLLNSWVRDKDKKNTYQMELVMQGASHARQASHAIGASELEVKMWVGFLVEERVGASYATGASELAVFSPDLVVGSTVMVIIIFASQSDEDIFGQVGVQAGQEPAKQGAHHDAGDPGGQVYARHGSHQVVRAFSWQCVFKAMLGVSVDREWVTLDVRLWATKGQKVENMMGQYKGCTRVVQLFSPPPM
jgi:hypothetical protein